MAKVSTMYLDIDPFLIKETGYHKERHQVSESIFSLANEYMGVRGFFDEGISIPHLVGTYFNGIIENSLEDTPSAYKGVVKRSHFTINSVNFFKCKIIVDGETLDLNKSSFDNFERVLDMRTGLLTRSFIWHVNDKNIKITFSRLLNMVKCENAIQKITFESNKTTELNLLLYLDGSILHWGNHCYWELESFLDHGIALKTPTTHQSLVVKQLVNHRPYKVVKNDKELEEHYKLTITPNKELEVVRKIVAVIDKGSDQYFTSLIATAEALLKEQKNTNFDEYLDANRQYFAKVWEKSDIEIEGNDIDQQGIRYCLFQLEQNYHGYEDDNNIGAKGLTGEAYSGHAFWDSETYCLPYYLFSDQKAAMNLLMFRYHTLKEAKARAIDLDCEGACYPIATRNGKEACSLWQHASCQIQPTTAVGYAIFHYMNLYHDDEFMNKYGLEMMLEICKFLLSRGQYSGDNKSFGYYGVMGPDEFQLMVNNNTYTNFMAKKMFEYLFSLLESGKYHTKELLQKCGYSDELLTKMHDAHDKMVILYDEKTKLFEQHDGYYKLPHIDIHSIPVTDFPLYSHWSYDRIYRNDIIKQPDVLMFMFLYSSEFTLEQKKANYEYYEPRCIHESSLSPSIHSIFASELGKDEEALNFFSFATRLDLDDYNRNTCEGLHMTSIAAAWMNIVYGFLGLRSDKEVLGVSPTLPSRWKKYAVNICYQNRKIRISVHKDRVHFSLRGEPISINVYGKPLLITNDLVIER